MITLHDIPRDSTSHNISMTININLKTINNNNNKAGDRKEEERGKTNDQKQQESKKELEESRALKAKN